MKSTSGSRPSGRPVSKAPLALLAMSLTATTGWAGDGSEPEAVEQAVSAPLVFGGTEYRRLEVQANTFTSSLQNAVTFDQDAAGNTVVVWQSRRQERGTYGIYAQRFSIGGERIGGELHVNAFTEGNQTLPAVALCDDGSTWFAWYSGGQDGSLGAILARRIGPDGSDSGELLVNQVTEGDQQFVTCGALPDGGAVLAWSTPDGEVGRGVAARFFAADGTAGDELRVDQGQDVIDDLPALDVDGQGRVIVAWARRRPGGAPQAIVARRLDASGEALGDEFVVAAGGGHIEPVVASNASGAFVLAWLTAGQADYHAWSRRYDSAAQPLGDAQQLELETSGYISGLAVDLRDSGDFGVAWNGIRHDDSDVWVRLYDRDGSARTKGFRPTALTEGNQRIEQASSRRHFAWSEDGRITLAWTGDAGLADSSAANLTLLVPESLDVELARERAPAGVFVDEELELAARPHEPPVFVPNLPRPDLDNIGAPESAPGSGFVGLPADLFPPDPSIAVGPGHVVEVVNQTIGIFTKGGTPTFNNSIAGGGGSFWDSVGTSFNSFVFDPEVIWDPHSNRFMAMANERNGSSSFFLLAVSDDTDPNGTWFKYRFDVTPQAGANIDSPNIGVDDQAIYLSADFFGPDRFLIFIVEKAPTLTGGVPLTRDVLVTGSQSYGSPVVYDTGLPAYYYVEGLFGNPANFIRVHAVTDPLGVPAVQTFVLSVPPYLAPEDPPQMGSSVRPETFEARMWSAVLRNGSLWATHHVDLFRVRQRWYEIDLGNWPASGTPSLIQSGEVDGGDPVRTFFGSINVDSLNNMSLVYARSSPNEFISMGCASRLAGDPLGTLGPLQTVQTSTGPTFVNRWGDYSAILSDPVAEGRFWGAHEFISAGSTLTWIASWDVADVPSSYCTAKTTSGGCVPFISFAGQASVSTAGPFRLQHNEAVPNQSGLLLYSSSKSNLNFHGGKLCVKSPVKRTAAKSAVNLMDGGCSNWAVRRNFNNTIQNGSDPQLTAGHTVFAQWLQRDPTEPQGFGDNLSDGLQFTINP